MTGPTEADVSQHKYDVAISFAGPQRDLAEYLATKVQTAGFAVFYDGFYTAQLWGKELPVVLDDICRKQSRYCLILVSKEYTERLWANHERRSALARAIAEKGQEYILPVRVDSSELSGI